MGKTKQNIPFHDDGHGNHDGPKDGPMVRPQGLHKGLGVFIFGGLLRLLEGVLAELLLEVLVDHLLEVVDLHLSRRHDGSGLLLCLCGCSYGREVRRTTQLQSQLSLV